jgi:hypothetical protein
MGENESKCNEKDCVEEVGCLRKQCAGVEFLF